ncbi:MAG: DUF1801 domain-containing protein [Bacteroidota bacterium]
MKKQQSVEEYLEQFPQHIRECAEELRSLIGEVIPDYEEKVYTGWKLIGYRAKKGNKSFYFAFIYPAEDKVVLGFEYGILLNDPHNLLSGSGSQVRQITFYKKSEINQKRIAPLIWEAAMIAIERRLKK